MAEFMSAFEEDLQHASYCQPLGIGSDDEMSEDSALQFASDGQEQAVGVGD
jgi:hypothetical protein